MSTTTFAEMLKGWRAGGLRGYSVGFYIEDLLKYEDQKCADEAQPIYDALRKLHKGGCHDGTCSSALISGMACDCWKSRLAAILGEEQK